MKLPVKRCCAFLYFIRTIASFSSITVPVENIIMPEGCSESKKYEFLKELTKVGNDDMGSGKYKNGSNYPFDSSFGSVFDSSMRYSPGRESNPLFKPMEKASSFDPCKYSSPYSYPSQAPPTPQSLPQLMQQPLPQPQPPGITTSQPPTQNAAYPIYIPVPTTKTVFLPAPAPAYQQSQSTPQPSNFNTTSETPQLPNDYNSFKANSYNGGAINCGTVSFNKPQQTANVQQMPFLQNLQNAQPLQLSNACIPTGNVNCQNIAQSKAVQAPLKAHSVNRKRKRNTRNRQKDNRVQIECDCRILPTGLEDCKCDKKK